MPASPNRTPSCSRTPRGSSETASRAEQETQQSKKKSVGVGIGDPKDQLRLLLDCDWFPKDQSQRTLFVGRYLTAIGFVCESINLLVVEIFPLSLSLVAAERRWSGSSRGLRDLNMDGACGGERGNCVSMLAIGSRSLCDCELGEEGGSTARA